MDNKKLYERNITLSYIQGSLSWGRFFIPVLALFYIASNVSIKEFGLIFGIFSLTILIFEVPSGIIADIIGKKKTIMLSKFLFVIEVSILALANGFWAFLIAKVISGIGVSLASGASQALVFDSLKKLNREHEHKKISGNIHSVSRISMAVVFITGAYFFSIDPKLPAILSLIPLSLSFLLTFFFTEAYKNEKKLTYNNSMQHLKEGFFLAKHNKFIVFIIIYSFLTFASINIILTISSLYFELISIPISLIGIFAFFSALSEAYSSKKADSIEKKLKKRKSFFYSYIILLLGFFLMSLEINYLGYLFYLLIPLSFGFLTIITNHYMNEHIQSKHRATILSINNLFSNLGMFILFPVFSYYIGIFSFGMATFFLFCLMLVYGILLLFISNKYKTFSNSAN